MLNDICDDAKGQMQKTVEAFKKQLAAIRTGRANVSILDGVRVDYYGSQSPVNQVANIQVLDAKTLLVKAWDKASLKMIEKAIMESNLGLMPLNDGEVIRIPIPPLTEERRRDFAKQAKVRLEEAKVAMRSVRRDANDMLRNATKEGEISEDEEKRGLKMVQDVTDQFTENVETLFEHKEKEIMTV